MKLLILRFKRIFFRRGENLYSFVATSNHHSDLSITSIRCLHIESSMYVSIVFLLFCNCFKIPFVTVSTSDTSNALSVNCGWWGDSTHHDWSLRSTCGKQRHKRVSNPFCRLILPDAIILICPSLIPQVQANVDVVHQISVLRKSSYRLQSSQLTHEHQCDEPKCRLDDNIGCVRSL